MYVIMDVYGVRRFNPPLIPTCFQLSVLKEIQLTRVREREGTSFTSSFFFQRMTFITKEKNTTMTNLLQSIEPF